MAEERRRHQRGTGGPQQRAERRRLVRRPGLGGRTADPWAWPYRVAQLVSSADTADELHVAVLTAATELVPGAPVAVAELVDGRLQWVAATGDVSAGVRHATDDAVTSGADGVLALRSFDGEPVLAVALSRAGRVVGALVVVAPASDDTIRGMALLASAAGPKLGRFRDAALTGAILAHASEVFTVCRTDGTVTYQSPSAAKVFGVPPTDSVGRNLVDLVPADEVRRTLDALRMPIGARSPAIGSRWYDEQGGTHFGETTAVNLVDEPAVGGILFATRDVTDRRALELELVHAQRLEAVGRLAAGIAHEVNTPVQFIGDNLHFLADAFDALVAASVSSALARTEEDGLAFLRHEVPLAVEQALQGVERVAAIVRAMKALGHPDGGTPRQADVNRIVVDACTVAHNAVKHVAVLNRDLGEDLPPVRCLAGDIGQVILNLLVNAADAVGEVVAGSGALGRISVGTRRQADSIVVTVADTGAGIDPSVAGHIFEPFFTTKKVGDGTGQGLALAAAVVERHGGTISFESAPGGGTTFTFTLPITGPPGPVPARP